MIEKIPEQVRVFGASLLGVSSPYALKFVEWSQPILGWLSSVIQVGVGAATLLYILAKWKALRKPRK
jgi:hypothetical protein